MTLEGVPGKAEQRLVLRLYVAGDSPNSTRARANLREICEHHFSGAFALEVVDALVDPGRCLKDGVLATPTLLRVEPAPQLRILGDLSDTSLVLSSLGLEEFRR